MFVSDPLALNLGCGVSFIKSNDWVNLDWQSNSKFVKKHNLLKGLPFQDSFFTLVYSSHLIEHLIQEDARSLLAESYRVLKPNGTLRLSLPDFEEMARSYLSYLDKGEFLKSQFVATEILDQCTRLAPSGSFPNWYKLASTDRDLDDFINLRTGISMKSRVSSQSPKKQHSRPLFFEFIQKLPKQLRNLIARKYIRLVILLLPEWFRRYHVSLATPGERHMWLYDYSSLSAMLKGVGFQNIEKVSDGETRSEIDGVLSLDFNSQMRPIKGISTMFVEATKPN